MDLQNYHDWIVERQRLLERIKELETENVELKRRLGEDVTPVAPGDGIAKRAERVAISQYA